MKPEESRSRDELVRVFQKGKRLKYCFFWGHNPKVPGRIDQSCLSNWFPASFEVDGQGYATSEQFMMAEKARLFGDEDTRSKILASKSPNQAKTLGRTVSGFNEEVWTKNRFDIVLRGNLEKFRQNKKLGDFLMSTGNKVLVEASPYDRVWGVGMARDHENIANPMKWKGLNLLGFALMEVRGVCRYVRRNP